MIRRCVLAALMLAAACGGEADSAPTPDTPDAGAPKLWTIPAQYRELAHLRPDAGSR